METIKIAGVKREAFGKKESKSIRKQGQVPCVIYGNGETVHFSVDARSLKPLIYTPQSFLIEFDIEGKKEVGVMREVQYHPVTDQVLHADFFHVIPGKPISIDVPVKLTGNSEGVKQGGKLILSGASGLKQGEDVFALELPIEGGAENGLNPDYVKGAPVMHNMPMRSGVSLFTAALGLAISGGSSK